MKFSFSIFDKSIKAVRQFLYRYGKQFCKQAVSFSYKFGKKFEENALYDLVKYGLLLFFVILYANKGFISHVYFGEQSVYCHICYHLEMEQESLRVNIKKHFDNISILEKKSWSKSKGGGFISHSISFSPESNKIRSKIYNLLRKHNEISLSMKYLDCDKVSKKYDEYTKHQKNPSDINSLCKYRGMSFFDKIVYHIKKII